MRYEYVYTVYRQINKKYKCQMENKNKLDDTNINNNKYTSID